MIVIIKEFPVGMMLVIAVVLLALANYLPLANAVGLFGVAGLAWCYCKDNLQSWIKAGLFLLLASLAFWVATYRPEGFS